jgi:hypothetical protein
LEDQVIEKPLSADEALDRLREAGRIEAASIAALGRMWGWKRERTSKALIRWEGAGHIQREEGPDGTVIIRVPGAVPADDPADDHAVPAGNPAGNDGPLPASDDVPAPGPGDVHAGNPDIPAFDAVPPLMEGPAVITGIPAPDDDVPAGIPAGNPAVTAPMVEKPVGVLAALEPLQWRIMERPAWRPIVLSLDAHPPAHPDAQRAPCARCTTAGARLDYALFGHYCVSGCRWHVRGQARCQCHACDLLCAVELVARHHHGIGGRSH